MAFSAGYFTFPALSALKEHIADNVDTMRDGLQKIDRASWMLERLFVYARMRRDEDSADSVYQGLASRSQNLPSWLAQPLGQLPTSTAAQIHELRFRTGHGIFLTMSGRQVCLKELSECPQSLRECILDQLQLEEIFHTLCGGAVHAHQNELPHRPAAGSELPAAMWTATGR